MKFSPKLLDWKPNYTVNFQNVLSRIRPSQQHKSIDLVIKCDPERKRAGKPKRVFPEDISYVSVVDKHVWQKRNNL